MKPYTETNVSSSQRKVGLASDYSARIQEAMRYDRLRSSDYPLVMTLMDAVLQGYTRERWEKEQQRTVEVLVQHVPEKNMAHASEANLYEQTVSCLKDLSLWPW
jgi:hypothetical protein